MMERGGRTGEVESEVCGEEDIAVDSWVSALVTAGSREASLVLGAGKNAPKTAVRERLLQQLPVSPGRQLNSHWHHIMHQRTEVSPVANHFNGSRHSIADMMVIVINQVRSCDPCLHKIKESRWMRTLMTSHPTGINLRVDSL